MHSNMARTLAILALAAGTLGGCSDDDGAGPDGPMSEIRVLNGASVAAAVDVLADGVVVVPGLPYNTTSAWTEVPAGSRALALRDAGTGAPLASLDADLVEAESYSLLASSSVLSIATPSPVDTGQPLPDRANIRVINSAPPFDSATTPPPTLLDVHVTAPGADLTGLAPAFTMNAEVPSYSSFLYADPGMLEVRFTATGSTTVEATSGAFSAAAGESWAVMLERLAGGAYAVAVVPE